MASEYSKATELLDVYALGDMKPKSDEDVLNLSTIHGAKGKASRQSRFKSSMASEGRELALKGAKRS